MEAIHADAGPALHVWPRDIGPPPDPGLRKHAQKFEQDGDGSHAGDAASVEWWRDLDQIGADEIEAAEFTDQTLGFNRRDARLWRPAWGVLARGKAPFVGTRTMKQGEETSRCPGRRRGYSTSPSRGRPDRVLVHRTARRLNAALSPEGICLNVILL